jgi:1-acyl-sn-glycerol-3-phosphate acyltransferase
MRAALLLSGCPLRVSGLEHLGAAPCVVMVANHSSYLDVVVLLAAIPQDFRFVANHQAATRPLVGMVIRKQGHLVVDRGSALSRVESARAMSRMLAAGKSLLVFPEGTRSAGSLGKFTSGAFRAAMRSGRPIVPIAIAGTAQIFPRRTLLCRWSAITVMVLQPMAASTTGNGAELAGRAARNIAVALQ